MTESAKLRAEAESIVRDLALVELLSAHGDARIVGSVALDLVVKRDIDVHLLVNTPDLLAVANSIYPRLLERDGVNEVRISDYRREGGVKLGIDAYAGPSGDWSIDIWITDREEATAFATVDELRAVLTPEMRAAILYIKRDYYWRGMLRDGISLRIYQAVVYQGVRTAREFRLCEGR